MPAPLDLAAVSAQFQEQGYVLIADLLPVADVAALAADLERWLATEVVAQPEDGG